MQGAIVRASYPNLYGHADCIFEFSSNTDMRSDNYYDSKDDNKSNDKSMINNDDSNRISNNNVTDKTSNNDNIKNEDSNDKSISHNIVSKYYKEVIKSHISSLSGDFDLNKNNLYDNNLIPQKLQSKL